MEVWIPTEETLSLELFQLRLKLPAALCKAMIQTHWAAWCLIEPQAVNPRKENQLIQIKVSQAGNGIVKGTPQPAEYL